MADDDKVIDAVARALAEDDGIRYWKIDDGPIKRDHEIKYTLLARRFFVAMRALRECEQQK